MSSAHSLLEADVCVVGYALNAKKLRKSSHDRSLRSDCSPSRGNDKLDKHTMCAETTVIRKLSDAAACCMEHEWKGGGLADILDSNSLSSPQGKDRASVHFVQLDHDVPLASQPKCHVIIHKLTEDIDNPSKDSTAKIGALGAYLQHNPQTIIVDPIDSVRKVISRARTCNHLSEIQRHMQDRCPFTQPRYCVVEEKQSTADIANQLKALHFSYPIICKPVQACGTPNSHNMVIIVSEADLAMMETPCVVQQYHDHDDILYKVYVIDTDVMVFRRQSLPNLFVGTGASVAGLRSVAFDSRKQYPTYADFVETDGEESSLSLARVVTLEDSAEIDAALQETFEAASAALRKEFGLSLFGFDVIIPSLHTHFANSHDTPTSNGCTAPCAVNVDTNGSTLHNSAAVEDCTSNGASPAPNIVVIDVNYFPSYKEVKDFPARLKRFLRSKMCPI